MYMEPSFGGYNHMSLPFSQSSAIAAPYAAQAVSFGPILADREEAEGLFAGKGGLLGKTSDVFPFRPF